MLYLLLQATYPSVASLATFLANYNGHANLQYLQEAVIDVVTAVEEQIAVRKEELARLKTETGSEIEQEVSADEGSLSRPVGLLQTLIVSLTLSKSVSAPSYLVSFSDHRMDQL